MAEAPAQVGIEAPPRSPSVLSESSYAVLVGACALAALAVALRSTDEVGSMALVVGFASVHAVHCWASAWLQRRLRADVWQLDGAFLAASLVLLPWRGVTLALGLGTLVGAIAERASARSTVIYASHMTLTAAAVSFVANGVGLGRPGSWQHLGVVLLGAVAHSCCMTFVVNLRDRLVWGSPFSKMLVTDLRFGLPRTPFVASLGYVAGLAGTISYASTLVAVPSMAAMVYVLAEHFRAKRDRERADTLFRTAQSAHASIDPDEVTTALSEAATSLLHAGEAEVRSGPPLPGEHGAPLETADDQWLIVRDVGIDSDDDQLLATIAAVGSSALENARMAEELRHRALHDLLTGLPNQLLFSDRVAQAVGASGRTRERFAVIAIDLDAFRKVNDSLGHGAGDDLLRAVAERMQQVIRPGDTVARLSGDTFMLLLPGIGTAESAGVLTEKLLASISRPVGLDGQDVFMTACAGLAFFPDDGQLPEHLLRNADSALHRAKNHGPGTYQIYAQGMNELAHQRLARESELHQAVRRDELVARYQPQVDLRTGRIIGVEALVRWEHPTLGMLAPVEFVPLAEESGLIVDVDTWVLRHAAVQAAQWLADGLPPVRVGVNLSARHFVSPERLIGTIRDVLVESGLPPMLLELEVTEGLAITGDDSALVLQRIRDMGVSISIDDFGTGYSMLGRLSRFPVDRLKIDRSFVKEIRSARDDAPIVAAIIAMARSLKIETVAEGVETLEQQTYLRNRSCDLAQGFLFSPPAEPEDVVRMLRTPSIGFNVSAAV